MKLIVPRTWYPIGVVVCLNLMTVGCMNQRDYVISPEDVRAHNDSQWQIIREPDKQEQDK